MKTSKISGGSSAVANQAVPVENGMTYEQLLADAKGMAENAPPVTLDAEELDIREMQRLGIGEGRSVGNTWVKVRR